jgi:hypothetical protein
LTNPQVRRVTTVAELLSLAAQAILDAYGDFEAADTDAMAAALRAAAPQMEFVQDHLKLLAIADELGNLSPPSK